MNRKVKKHSKKNKSESFLLLVLVLLAASLLFKDQIFNKNNTEAHYNSVEELPKGLQSQINSYLKDGARKTEILKESVEIENTSDAQSLDGSFPVLTEEEKRVHRLRLDQENTSKRIAEELDRKYEKNMRPLTPDERLAQKLERDQYIQDYNKKYRDEYVKQFIENARAKGVNIRLDEDLNVTGINTFDVEKPIRVPQSVPKDGVK